ncbi:MAG: hypothetical protein KatS3mg042_0221 [Rhodothermaceae bacterium]|nr:MAG: hypothetical protein KatS3mg042_0221 [Rhodothermaceae bacterium]
MRVRNGLRKLAGASLLAGLLVLAACDGLEPARFEPELVVESYQIAGRSLQPVWVRRTAEINTPYDPEARAVSGARVEVALLDTSGGVEQVVPFREVFGDPGRYVAEVEHRVQPLRRYRLSVEDPATGQRLTAETLVPDTFRVAGVNRDTVVYQSRQQFEVQVTPSRYPGRQSYYVLSVEALTPTVDNLTPLYRDFVDPEDSDPEDLQDDLRNFTIVESPIINESSFDIGSDGTVSVRLPWLGVAFYGPNRVTVSALDDNLYDFLRSQAVQQGGSTLAPGEIPNVIEHVEGGRGLFSSLAQATFEVFVAREAE